MKFLEGHGIGHGVGHVFTHQMRHSPPKSIGDAIVKIGVGVVAATAAEFMTKGKGHHKCVNCGHTVKN